MCKNEIQGKAKLKKIKTKGGFMKYQLFVIAMLAVSCSDIQKAIEEANKKTETDTDTSTEVASDTRTGSRTVTKSVTTTVSESGDQSILKDADLDSDDEEKEPASNAPKSPVVVVLSPIVGTWFENCDDGISYKKVFGKDGTLKIYTYVHDDQDCETDAQVFIQRMKYNADDKYVQIGKEPVLEINVSNNNNTVILGDQELQKH